MGQKAHPTGIRLGIVKRHTSLWYAEGEQYANNLLTDLKVREHIRKKLANASVSRVDIERPAETAKITIHTARPGIVIGKKGEDVERLRVDLTGDSDGARPARGACQSSRRFASPRSTRLLVAQNVRRPAAGTAGACFGAP